MSLHLTRPVSSWIAWIDRDIAIRGPRWAVKSKAVVIVPLLAYSLFYGHVPAPWRLIITMTLCVCAVVATAVFIWRCLDYDIVKAQGEVARAGRVDRAKVR